MKINVASKISYQYIRDEIPEENLFKIYTAMLKWYYKKSMLGNNNTLITFIDANATGIV